jgi:hypothetical protein
MRTIVFITTLMLLPATAARAQDVTLPKSLERLADKAVQSVNVTVDGPLLQLASKFLSPNDPEQRAVKSLIGSLKGIYVRSFEFAVPGEYTPADVELLRSQLKEPAWTRMASVRSRKEGEDVDVFFRMEKERIAGLVVIAAGVLTAVSIVGPVISSNWRAWAASSASRICESTAPSRSILLARALDRVSCRGQRRDSPVEVEVVPAGLPMIAPCAPAPSRLRWS